MNPLILEAIATLIFSIFLYNQYSTFTVSKLISIVVISVWFLTFLGIFIIPLDIYYSCFHKDSEDSTYTLSLIRYLWQIIYWTVYILSWCIIPILQEYEAAGDFTFFNKLKRSLKRNAFFYLVLILIGSIFIAYLLFEERFTFNHLLSFLVSTSNSWGILLSIFLLGYGLVAFPKTLFINSEIAIKQKRLEWYAKETKDELDNKKEELSILITKLNNLKTTSKSKPSSYSSDSISYIELQNKVWSKQEDIEKEIKKLINDLNYEDLVDINRDIKLFKHEILRSSCELEETYYEWDENNLLLSSLTFSDSGKFLIIKQVIMFHLKTWLLRLLALQAIVMSLAIIISEITLYTKINFSVFGTFIDSTDSLFLMHILTIIPLVFLFIACLFGLFNLRISGLYGMYSNNHTDSTSLLFISGFMCRIGIPLCINFVQILKLKNKTVLEEIVGSTELDPFFGSHFYYIYPTVLLLVLIFTTLNIYHYILKKFGISSYNFKSTFSEEKTSDGEVILKKMKIEKINNFKYDNMYKSIDNKGKEEYSNSVLTVEGNSDD